MTEQNKIIYTLPPPVTQEILKLLEGRGREVADISEIRLRLHGKNSFKLYGERIDLCSAIKREDMERTFLSLCGGAIYSHRDTIAEGYISCFGGIRIGVCGDARYDGGRLVGVSDISSLVYRLPCDAVYEMRDIFRAFDASSRGLLIYSPPGVGKTTALRSLAGYIGGVLKKQLSVVDTRREFRVSDYRLCHVDVLAGYKRDRGIEIALRTLSPDVIMVDEIGGASEAELMLESLNSGVKLVATAHAGSMDELRRRRNLRGFFDADVFDVFAGIKISGQRRIIEIEGG